MNIYLNMGSWLLVRNHKSNGIMRRSNLENMFQLLNICVALFLFSHSSLFPITLQKLSHLYHALIFHNTFYAFLLLNAIILFLFALSNKHQPRTLLTEPLFEESVAAVTETIKSESFERGMVVGGSPELGKLKRPLQRRLRCVEQLSEDEFNRAVEDFIAMHKRMQWEEQIQK